MSVGPLLAGPAADIFFVLGHMALAVRGSNPDHWSYR